MQKLAFLSQDSIVHTGDTDTRIRFLLAIRSQWRLPCSERLRITSTGQLNLAVICGFTQDPELEFNNGGPRFRVPANTFTIHTGGGLGATSNERLRITSAYNINRATIVRTNWNDEQLNRNFSSRCGR